MKAVGAVFSARKRGNRLNCVEYVLEKLKENGFTTEVVKAYDYEIKSCSHCNYQCFAKELRGIEEKCPIHDYVHGGKPAVLPSQIHLSVSGEERCTCYTHNRKGANKYWVKFYPMGPAPSLFNISEFAEDTSNIFCLKV